MQLAIRLARRHLGETTTCPPVADLAAKCRRAHDFFVKPAISYKDEVAVCVPPHLQLRRRLRRLRPLHHARPAEVVLLDLLLASPWALSNLIGVFGGSSNPL